MVNPKQLGMYAGLILAVILIFFFIQAIWVTVLSAAVATIVALLVHARLAGETQQSQAKTEASEATGAASTDDAPEWIAHLQGLVHFNIAIREHALSEGVTHRLEETIDILRRLLPELNDAYVGSELTWTVNRMATDYLPRVVNPYIQLSPAGRSEHQDELLKSLAGLEAELANIESLVRDHKVGDFKAKAAFLRARFLDSGLG